MIPGTQIKKVFVTGGMGFIGSHFLLRCCENFPNIDFINIDNLSYAVSQKTKEELSGFSNYDFCNVDICNFDLLKQVIQDKGADLVVHFAAESHVDNSIDSPLKFINTNILGTYNLLTIIRELRDGGENILFHHVSTDEVYGSLGLNDDSFTEESNFAPSSPYSASKASSDLLVESWGKTFGLDYLITNCSNNFGPRQFHEKLIPKVIFNCIGNKQIPVYGSGTNIRDWLYVDDHIEAILSIYGKGLFNNERFNIGGGHEVSNLEIVTLILDILDKKHGFHGSNELISFVDDRRGHDFRYSIDNTKIKKATGWKPQSSFEEQLNQTIHWYLNHSDWWEK
tara:strand:+ start:3511 stop:4527 length:1017 start_codon:yes stop_codon:yes gene_type:complete